MGNNVLLADCSLGWSSEAFSVSTSSKDLRKPRKPRTATSPILLNLTPETTRFLSDPLMIRGTLFPVLEFYQPYNKKGKRVLLRNLDQLNVLE